MNARAKYEAGVMAEVIQLFTSPRPPRSTISDADYENELAAAAIFYNALKQFRGATLEASKLSEMRKSALTELLDSLEDLTPNMTAWEEEISNARRGYIGSGLK